MKNLLTALMCAVMLALAFSAIGCAAKGHPFQSITPMAGSGVIYVYRPDELQGAAITLDIRVDDEPLGGLKNNGYLYKAVPSGPHVVTCKTESTATVNLNVVAGREYYIEGEVKMGILMGRPKLTLVAEETGQSAITPLKYSGKDEPAPS